MKVTDKEWPWWASLSASYVLYLEALDNIGVQPGAVTVSAVLQHRAKLLDATRWGKCGVGPALDDRGLGLYTVK